MDFFYFFYWISQDIHMGTLKRYKKKKEEEEEVLFSVWKGFFLNVCSLTLENIQRSHWELMQNL